MHACLVCYKGLENVVKHEVTQKTTLQITHVFSGAVYVLVSSIEDVLLLTYRLQTISSIFLVDYNQEFSTPLETITQETLKQKLSQVTEDMFRFLPSLQVVEQETVSFAVRVSGLPKDMKNSRFERMLGDTVYHHLTSLFPKQAVKVDLTNPDLLIQAQLIDDRIHIGLDWLQKQSSVRDYKVMNSYRSLPGPIAAAPAVLLSETAPKRVFVSAVYTGEVCIETALYRLGLSPHFFSQDYVRKRLRRLQHDKQQIEEIFSDVSLLTPKTENVELYGFDNNSKRLSQAEKNLLLSQVAENCTLEQRERSMIVSLDLEFDAAILDLLPSKNEAIESGTRAIEEVSKTLSPNATIVLMLRNVSSVSLPSVISGFSRQDSFTVLYGNEPILFSVWQKHNS